MGYFSFRSSHSNAYFYGFFNFKRIVLFDTLLEQSEREKLKSKDDTKEEEEKEEEKEEKSEEEKKKDEEKKEKLAKQGCSNPGWKIVLKSLCGFALTFKRNRMNFLLRFF